MRIGIDIDDTIVNTSEMCINYVKKLDKKAIKDGYVPGLDTVPPFEDYINEIFNEKDWPGLRFVYLSNRTLLEHNPKTQHWYLV